MKNILFIVFIMFALYGTGQNIVLGDFEDGQLNGWNGWGIQAAIANNPDITGNTSTKVGMLDQTGGAWNGFAKWFNTPILKQNSQKIIVDVYFKNTEGTFKLQMDNSVSGTPNFEAYKEIEANQWTQVEFDISIAEALDYRQIAFQSSVADTFYIDNIVLIQGAPVDELIGDFENNNLQNWSTWGAPLSVVANPLIQGNNSEFVAEFDQSGGAWSGIAKWSDTPALTENHIGISIDVFFPSLSGQIKLQMDNSISGAQNVEMYSDSVGPGQWHTIFFDTRNIESFDYKQIAFQSGVADMFYFDNITLKVPVDSVATPDNFTANTSSASSIDLSWNLNQNNDSILLAVSENEITDIPLNGQIYTVNDELNNGAKIIYRGTQAEFTVQNLPANTQHFFSLWSFNEKYTYSDAISTSIKTLYAEPSNHVLNLGTTKVDTFTIEVEWETNSGTNPAQNYALFINETKNEKALPTDGTPVSEDLDLSDGFGIAILQANQSSYLWENLKHSTQYTLTIYPYANSSNTIDYKINEAPEITANTTVIDDLENPLFTPEGGQYSDSIVVEITCNTENAEIYYTVNGDDPNTESVFYTEAIVLYETTVVKAISKKDEQISEIVSMNYEISNTQITNPLITPESGEYSDSVTITLACETPDALILYSFDNSAPSIEYTQPFVLYQSATVKAVASINNSKSDTIENNYTITITHPTIEVETIADLRNTLNSQNQTEYLFTGEAVVTYAMDFRGQKFIQDETGAILIDDNNGIISQEYQIGHAITNVSGTVSEYAGMLQFTPTSEGSIIEQAEYIPLPLDITLEQLQSNFAEYESKLIKINSLSFSSDGNFESGQDYTIMQGNVEGKLRTHFYDADYIGSEIPEKNQNLIGIAILHNNEAKIVPRALSDFETITSIELYAQKISIFGGKQTICIDKSNLSTGNISVYSISGQLIKHSEISEKFSAINIYKRGTYIAVYSENGLVIKKQKVQVQ